MKGERRIWLITDTHFNHAKLVEYEGRPTDFTEQIIKNWKGVVSPADVTIHLGDVIMSNAGSLSELLKAIPGKKVLVRGNHDRRKPSWYLNHGFDFVCDSFLLDEVWFTHIPADSLPDGARTNIHGHLHKNGHREGETAAKPFHKLLHIEDTLSPILLTDFLEMNHYKEIR